MSKGRKSGKKVRVEFRQNRVVRRRSDEWTRRFEQDEDRTLDARSHESIRPKGDLSRKRTIMVDEREAPLVDESLWRAGTTIAVHGLVCRVCDEQGRIWDCTVRRVLRTLAIEQRAPVTVGDRVWFSVVSEPDAAGGGEPPAATSQWRRLVAQTVPAGATGSGVGVIERVAERRTRLSRKERRGREHTIVANADQLIIVASVVQPRLKPHLIDRYIVAAHKGGLRPVIVLNKADLAVEREADEPELPDAEPDAEALERNTDYRDETEEERSENPAAYQDEYEDMAEIERELVDMEDEYAGGQRMPRLTVGEVIHEYETLGYRVVLASAATGLGVEALRLELRGRVSVFSGQSGVGKSSLINTIQPGLRLSTGEVSEVSEKGRHTTSHAQLLPLDLGGFVVDTPGVRGFDLWQIEPQELEAYFIEIAPRVAKCQFSNCTHVSEEGCGVIEAVTRGEISTRRYGSYVKMFAEAAALKRW